MLYMKNCVSIMIVACILSALLISGILSQVVRNLNMTTQIIEPCCMDEVINFLQLTKNNAADLDYAVILKKTKNSMTKILWSLRRSDDNCDVEYIFYVPREGTCFYSHKERSYGCDYVLYKNKLHNDEQFIYLLVYNHSGSYNFGGVIGAWAILSNGLEEMDCSCFYSEACPEHIAHNFVIQKNGKFYLRFMAWETNENENDQDRSSHLVMRSYIWKNNSLSLYDGSY